MLPSYHNNYLLATNIFLPISFGCKGNKRAIIAGDGFGYRLSAVIYVALLFDFRLEFIQEGEELGITIGNTCSYDKCIMRMFLVDSEGQNAVFVGIVLSLSITSIIP